MVEAANQRGYDYIAITDHAKGLKIAGGINEAQIAQQAKEIEAVNDSFESTGRRLRVLYSIELNLNVAGEGDMDAVVLAQLDIVLGCFHSTLRKNEDNYVLSGRHNDEKQLLGFWIFAQLNKSG